MNIVDRINGMTWLTEDLAKLLLRVTVGLLILMHGIFKLQNPEAIGFIGGMLSGLGLPAILAYLVYIGEVVAPIMLIVGYQTKVAALLVVINMVVAILLVHSGELFAMNPMSGGHALELQLMFLLGALAVFGLGAGKHVLLRK